MVSGRKPMLYDISLIINNSVYHPFTSIVILEETCLNLDKNKNSLDGYIALIHPVKKTVFLVK